jgi:hypothetical protein
LLVKQNNKIPKLIWQTAKSTPHHSARKFIESWDLLNPKYQRILMDDERCDSFIKDNFSPEFYKVYASLPMGIMRADMWRVAVVYIYGGVYADIDCECVVPLDTWLADYSLVVAVETDNGELSNFFFAATPKHPALLSVLNRLLELVPGDGPLENNNLFVQNFGQYGFSDGILQYYKTPGQVKKDNTRFFTKTEQRITNHIHPTSYVAHYVASENWVGYDSWRKEQANLLYKPAEIKPIKFITTFSKIGYEVYGKTWIETFSKNVLDPNITADIYIDFSIPETDRITLIDFDKAIPYHNDWVNEFTSKFTEHYYNQMMGVRFSYKAHVMIHALENNKDCYVIWLDGDCIFKPNQEFASVVSVLYGNAVAVQREANGGEDHCESGFVLVDVDHPDAPYLLKQFKTNYEVENIIKMFAPFDGFVLYKSLAGIQYTNLNEVYGKQGIQGNPDETFLHPELKKRFLHNIGPTGKSSYANWKEFANSDKFFKLINTHPVMSENDMAKQRLALLNIQRTTCKRI